MTSCLWELSAGVETIFEMILIIKISEFGYFGNYYLINNWQFEQIFSEKDYFFVEASLEEKRWIEDFVPHGQLNRLFTQV